MLKKETVTNDGINEDYEFDKIAQNIFYPIYDVIAEDILLWTGSTEGNLIDIGCGGGHLGMALMQKTAHIGYFVDINEAALKIARTRAEERGLSDRTVFLNQDVHKMDFPDGFASLIISRGSYHFWEDTEKAFLEIYRILSPGGKTCIGGGLGNAELAAAIRPKMKQIMPGWPECINRRRRGLPMQELGKILQRRAIDYEIIDENEDQGRWILLKKGTDERDA